MLGQGRLPFQTNIPQRYKEKLRNRINIEVICNSLTNAMSIQYHYLHRARTGGQQISHGIFLDNYLVGFVVYSSPTFHTKKGLMPPLKNNGEVIELARFWLRESCPKHSATCALGKSLKGIRQHWLNKYGVKPLAVVSYADRETGHEGIIYQAANFFDCGFAPMARFADVGQCYSRSQEGWGAGHYDFKSEKQSAPRTSDTKRFYIYFWGDIPNGIDLESLLGRLR